MTTDNKEEIREAIERMKKLGPQQKAFACGKMTGRCDRKEGERK